jgi:hypothetical protein
MNFAFPALLAFVFLLPGIILRFSYARGSWGWSSPISMRRLSDDFAYGAVFSIALHTLWLGLASLLGFRPDLKSVLALMAGNFGPNNEFLPAALEAFSANFPRIAGYFLTIYAASAILGHLGHRLVRAIRLDHKTKLFRFNNYWFYMLRGEVLLFAENSAEEVEEPDGVYLSAVVSQSSKSYLYRGLVCDFTFDEDGKLDTIVLADAHRRDLMEDAADDGIPVHHDEDPRYYDIKGDYLILQYSRITTLNLDYFWLTESTAPSENLPAKASG